jgi:four helix bundle protein
MRRCSYSLPANIAEGCGRESKKEFKRFLVLGSGSATELEYFLILIKDLKLAAQQDIEILIEKVDQLKRSLNRLTNKLG